MSHRLFAAVATAFLSLGTLHGQVLYVTVGNGGGAGNIDRLDTSGAPSLFAGNFSGVLAVDAGGNLYVADGRGDAVTRYDPAGNPSLFVSFASLSVGESGGPGSLAFDRAGNLYAGIDAPGISGIAKVTPSGTVTLLVTVPTTISGIAVDATGNLYFSDPGGSTGVEKLDPSGNLSLFATLPHAYGSRGLAFDAAGNLYVASATGVIMKFDPSGVSSVFASLPGTEFYGLAFDSAGNLYAANSDDDIWRFDPSGNGSVFAEGLDSPGDVAVKSPEPGTLSLLALGGLAMLRRRKMG